MNVTPASSSLFMSSTLTSAGIIIFSFCRPSLGATSTILTKLGSRYEAREETRSFGFGQGLRRLRGCPFATMECIVRTFLVLGGTMVAKARDPREDDPWKTDAGREMRLEGARSASDGPFARVGIAKGCERARHKMDRFIL
jgi:hypothetical protein